jgi:UDP-N-acetylglucosamine--N-acetylmuramyl-(pentapeptide) pyrophosphoryl-undecaprenol N-acetylglucosamine transferase
MKRVVVTTGGTGGHIFPALAVAQALRVMHPGLSAAFVGGQGPEGALARKAGLRFVGLPAKGVFGRGMRGVLEGLLSTRAAFMAMNFYRTFKPGLVAGFGGYASFFPMLAAWFLGIPTVLHEQNSVPGVTNRLLGKLATRVFITYPDEAGVFDPKKTVLTGNPVRHDIAALWDAPARTGESGRHILVLGGSQGAKAVNAVVLEALPRLLGAGFKVTIQTGRADFERVIEAAAEVAETRRSQGLAQPGELVIENFIEDMAADLIIARSGASTLAEVTSAKKPAILVPFPHATHDHQTVNASFMARAGAAVLIEQQNLEPQALATLVIDLFDHPERLAAMAQAAGELAAPRAAETIARELTALGRDTDGGRT